MLIKQPAYRTQRLEWWARPGAPRCITILCGRISGSSSKILSHLTAGPMR